MIKPLENNVLVKMMEEEDTTKSGIILATSKEKSQVAKVIAVGPGLKVDGKLEEMYVKEGDKVLLSKFSGTEIKYENEDYIIVRQSDILAIVE